MILDLCFYDLQAENCLHGDEESGNIECLKE